MHATLNRTSAASSLAVAGECQSVTAGRPATALENTLGRMAATSDQLSQVYQRLTRLRSRVDMSLNGCGEQGKPAEPAAGASARDDASSQLDVQGTLLAGIASELDRLDTLI